MEKKPDKTKECKKRRRVRIYKTMRRPNRKKMPKTWRIKDPRCAGAAW